MGDPLAEDGEGVHRPLQALPGRPQVPLRRDEPLKGGKVLVLELGGPFQKLPEPLPLRALLLLARLLEELQAHLQPGEVEPGLLEHLGEPFRLLNADGAHEDGLAPLVLLGDLLHHGVELPLLRAVDHVGEVLADHRAVGGHHHHVHPVDLLELLLLGLGGARHPRPLLVEAEEVLVGDGGQGLVLPLNPDPSLASMAWWRPSP